MAIIAGLVVTALASHNRAGRAASLLEKVVLTARTTAPNAATAVWRSDTQSGKRILQSLASDPDFGSGIIVDDKGEIFASSQDEVGSTETISPTAVATLLGIRDPGSLKVDRLQEFVRDNAVISVIPLLLEEKGEPSIGYMALSFSRQRAKVAAMREIIAIGAGGAVALLAVCSLLAWLLSRVTRPIRDMTQAMARLSLGELDTPIPALDRCDEVGAMARTLVVFKENSRERERLEFLTGSLEQTTEDLRRESEKVANLVRYDAMTGLRNRASFTEQLSRVFAAAMRDGTSFAVLCLDVDRFKDVNDALGHDRGDLLLQAVARRLASVVREGDVIGRLGGDEFAVLAMNAADPKTISALARRINQTLNEMYELAGNRVYASASIGISIFAPTLHSPDEMMTQADLALNRSKQTGRNNFSFHSLELDTEARERAAISSDLHAALERNELELYYQPQVEIATGRITGLEALLRWKHPERGLISPDVFIPIAEVTGVILPIGRWVLDEACRQFQRWNREGLTLPLLAINVSAAQFKASPNLDDELEQVFARYGIDPGKIELELTESALMEATESSSRMIERLRSLGVGIAIDDFGTGYSSLAYLRSYRVSRLKIAQDFVRDIATRADDAAIVRATIGLARELGIDVVAEGVETAAALRLIEAAGCRCVQGYYFSRPVPADVAGEMLRRGVLSAQADAVAAAPPVPAGA
jgi:diguanylate cyclase (GGDEF)-like protein